MAMTEATALRIIRSHVPAAIARGLAAVHRQNRTLWELEDKVRSTNVATTIARHKAGIDRANLARHAAVKVIDAAVLARYPRGLAVGARGAVVDSASVGQMLDRLSILALKRARITAPTSLQLASAQWDHVLACLDRAIAACKAGTWVHHPAGEVKQYGR
ncbi:MAG TPA: DUF4254 domain-containing protein [Kofleriaceae bacterium]